MAHSFYEDLRARALRINPTKQDTKTLIIAVYVQLHESVDVQTISDKELLLFNARHTTKLSTLLRQADIHVKKLIPDPNASWTLIFRQNPVLPNQVLGTFNIYRDDLVLFVARPGPPKPDPIAPSKNFNQQALLQIEPFNEVVPPQLKNFSQYIPNLPSQALASDRQMESLSGAPAQQSISHDIGSPQSTPIVRSHNLHQHPITSQQGISAMHDGPPVHGAPPLMTNPPIHGTHLLSNAPSMGLIDPFTQYGLPPSGPLLSEALLPSNIQFKTEPASNSSPHHGFMNTPGSSCSTLPANGHPDARFFAHNGMPNQVFGDVIGASMSVGVHVGDTVNSGVKNEEGAHQNSYEEISRVQLQQLFENANIETMEKAIKMGLDLLTKLLDAFGTAQDDTSKAWIAQIDKTTKQAEFQPTVIGVVGNTGAGKSSMINALLDEERLVPTNCMRACTAVVTEISYNTETEHPYRAQIEFITAEDWEMELRALFQDLFDECGEMKNVSRDTDAVAWAKIKAVYPQKTKEAISTATVEQLVQDNHVKPILGKTKVLEASNSSAFYRHLQRYVDSQEKAKKDDKTPREMEYWPLIRVVKLSVKSPVLQTGAVVVDLPGVHDANAARAAVADSYMQKCTGLWIVAPITRAVDDKTAHKLLGEGFRRQLLMDGGFSSISFICSKSDDVSVSEAMLSLHLEDELDPQSMEIEKLDKQRVEKQQKLDELQETRNDIADANDELDEQLSTWDELKDKAEDGETVYAPKMQEKKKKKKLNKKRKRLGALSKTSKKAKHPKDNGFIISDNSEQGSLNSDEEESDSEDQVDLAEDEDGKRGDPLTLEEIDEKIEELRSAKKEGRRMKMDIAKSITALRGETAELNDNITEFKNALACRCIEERNKYSTAAIQQDFAAGLQELDHEEAEEKNREDFDPNVAIRDYEQVANSLPVFCVSSRGYQKLQGRLKKDGDPSVFQNLDQTGMPALQTHCAKLTEKVRLASGRRFLTSVSQLCNSLQLWSSGVPVNLSQADKDRQVRRLNIEFSGLDKKLDRAIDSTATHLKEELVESIFERYDDAVNAAARLAPVTSDRWGWKVSRMDPKSGGYYWSTYKALCRRDGVFSNTSGHHDLNQELAEPLIKVIASNWEKVFSRRVPIIVKEYARLSKDAIDVFHKAVAAHASPGHAGHLQLLSGQLSTYGDVLKAVANEVVEIITVSQREISREFNPMIMEVMRDVYRICTEERGPGQFMRMKEYMRVHVNAHQRDMFEHSVNTVKRRLLDMVKNVEAKLDETTATLFAEMSRDYHSIFGGTAQDFSGGASRGLRDLKDRLQNVLEDFEKPFKAILNEGEDPQLTPPLEHTQNDS